MMLAWLAAVATLGGAFALYVAAPHQAVFAGHVLHRRAWQWVGAALLAVALALLLAVQGYATAVFTWSTGAMLVWSTVPIVVRWWRFRRDVR